LQDSCSFYCQAPGCQWIAELVANKVQISLAFSADYKLSMVHIQQPNPLIPLGGLESLR